jgi:hypothetical protein
MMYILRIIGLAVLFDGILNADVYTYTYTGANFDTYCAFMGDFEGGYVPCGPISGPGFGWLSTNHMTGIAAFSQPIGPNQTVNLSGDSFNMGFWDFEPPYWQFYGGFLPSGGPNSASLSLTTNSLGRIVSWDVQYWVFGSWESCSDAYNLSSSSGGDATWSEAWQGEYFYETYSTSTPGTWTANFTTPEPAQTPVKSVLLLASMATMVSIRKRRRQRPAYGSRVA